MCVVVVCYKRKTANEMRISDWSSDVCSSDLLAAHQVARFDGGHDLLQRGAGHAFADVGQQVARIVGDVQEFDTRAEALAEVDGRAPRRVAARGAVGYCETGGPIKSEERRVGKEVGR